MRPIQIKRNKAALDRAEELRNQPELLEKFWDQAKIIHLSNQKFLVNEAGSLKYLSSRELSSLSNDFLPGLKIFLGQLDDQVFGWSANF